MPFSENVDSVLLQAVDIVSSVKLSSGDSDAHYSATSVRRVDIENRHLNSVKEFSSLVPNFYQPDYGSRMTSSIYVRGFGSRMDQPVVGMNIDGVPVLNKNGYDFELFDIDRVQVVRGAQGTLFGRNTSGGAVNVYTMSPLYFQGKRLVLEYGNANTVRAKASHYGKVGDDFGWSVGLHYNHSDGFFANKETGNNCDGGDNAALRLRAVWRPVYGMTVDNIFTAGYTAEGGWAYRNYDSATGNLAPVAYNYDCSYRRMSISDGLVFKYVMGNATISSTTGYCYLGDRMLIDNDFLPLDYFTMGQYQREHSVTQEFVLDYNAGGVFNVQAGVSGFYKRNDMSAPVNFKQYGIENLILKNANEYYYYLLGDNRELSFRENEFTIDDDFLISGYGTAAYVQGGAVFGGFRVNAGLRADYEHSAMDYLSKSSVYYTTYKGSDNYSLLYTLFKGKNSLDAFELLPSVSVSYGGGWGNVYASARRGFKAGGFNTQLFSDILQNKMIGELVGNESDVDASSTVYRPETNWCYELGTHLSPLDDGSLDVSAALFYIDCRNQQLTVFPEGESTGRMMSNAGKSFSCGAELSLRYRYRRFKFDAAFGYTHAEFREYNRGDKNLAGNILPYAPRETMSANVAYRIPVPKSFANIFVLNVGWNAVGRIYWNEENTLSQGYYDLWSASLVWEKGHFGASLWGKNLLNREYNTFYFRSIKNDFFAQGKPLQLGVSLHVNL